MEENEKITEKKICPKVVPDSPELGQQVILRTLILPGTWSYLYKKSVYNLHPYMEGVF